MVNVDSDDDSDSSDDSLSLRLRRVFMSYNKNWVGNHMNLFCPKMSQKTTTFMDLLSSALPSVSMIVLIHEHLKISLLMTHLHLLHVVELHTEDVPIPCFGPSMVVYSAMFVASMTSRIWL